MRVVLERLLERQVEEIYSLDAGDSEDGGEKEIVRSQYENNL